MRRPQTNDCAAEEVVFEQVRESLRSIGSNSFVIMQKFVKRPITMPLLTRIAKLPIYPNFGKIEGVKSKLDKTFIKQLLDIEAKEIVTRCHDRKWNLVLEDPKILSNLQPKGKIAAWVKTYFFERATVLAEELGVFVWKVHPAYTSITCSNCDRVSRKSRDGRAFKCSFCRLWINADLNGALNIALKGALEIDRLLSSRSGRVKMVPICCPRWAA